MYLKQLQIENFKCFREEQTFDFGKITLLTGANSSGKSSAIYAVLGCLQSGEFPLRFSPNGKYVNMGSFKEIVCNQNDNNKIKISFKFQNSEIVDIGTNWVKGEDTLFSLNDLLIDSCRIAHSTIKGFNPTIDQGEKSAKDMITARKAVSVFEEYEQKINFVGSFRLDPQRTYLEVNRKESKIDKSGDGYLEQIIAWETQKSEKFEKLVHEMKELSLLENIKSKRMEGGRYEFKVKTNNGIYSSLNDVGYGISQFLPIMVADLQLPDDSQLFVSQPEIHLHPSVQSLFGDYLVKQVNRSDKRYVVETHSEYLLNKIRLAIVKRELEEEAVTVYYLQNNGTDTEVHKIIFSKNGQILNAPQGFFDTYMTDSMEIAINAVE